MRVDEGKVVVSSLDARNAARKAKNFKEADRIRDELKAMGVELEDKKDGTTVEGEAMSARQTPSPTPLAETPRTHVCVCSGGVEGQWIAASTACSLPLVGEGWGEGWF